MKQVHVLSWRFKDGSGSGVLRTYADTDRAHARAQEDLDLLEWADPTRKYKLEDILVYGG
jgi:hypothetical protein